MTSQPISAEPTYQTRHSPNSSNIFPSDDSFVHDAPTTSPNANMNSPNSPTKSSNPHRRRPSNLRVQSALITAQICFGVGGVISALGLPACNPFAFALYREIAAGSMLLAASSYVASRAEYASPSVLREWRRFILLGLALFGNQACVIAGIKLAGPVAAAVWQPSQPIMTAAISMMLGWEAAASRRILGVLISFAGCAGMVVLSAKQADAKVSEDRRLDDIEEASSPSNQTLRELVGHALFFSNCLCTSLYVLLSKKPLKIYPPMKVTAWSYTIAAVFMATLAYLISFSDSLVAFLCPECTGTWNVPPGAIFALAYAIVFNSVIAYFLITWSNQYATGTLVIGYSVLQPVTAALLTALLLGIGLFPSCDSIDGTGKDAEAMACLDPPGWGAILGMMGVLTGLSLVVMTEPSKTECIGDGKENIKYEQVAVGDQNGPSLGDLELA